MTERTYAVVIVGTGFSGLGVAVRLMQEGIEDFTILERSDGVGGTWRFNTYPGCACDVQSHLYSFSFAPNAEWSHRFAPQPEILAYLEDCADRFGLRDRIQLETELRHAEWDEASATWRILAGDQWIRARSLVLGLGPFQAPRTPDLPGQFDGPAFHSARWDHSVDLRGKRVAVIGTGASAIQVVPSIAPDVAELYLFQRTPPWIVERNDRRVGRLRQALYRHLPGALRARRYGLYWSLEVRALAMTRYTGVLKHFAKVAERHMRSQIDDPALQDRLVPDYMLGCKRVLLSDDYYPALNRPNVELLSEAVASLEPGAVVGTDGSRREVDAIVWCTGFHVTDTLPELPFVGREGLTLTEAWSSGPEAYLGTVISGFPNLYMMLGPNTGLGHNSMVFMIESQLEQVIPGIRAVESGRARSVEVREEAQRTFNARIQERLSRSVWLTGCRSWYVDEDGVNRTIWPDFTWRYLQRARDFREADYRME